MCVCVCGGGGVTEGYDSYSDVDADDNIDDDDDITHGTYSALTRLKRFSTINK